MKYLLQTDAEALDVEFLLAKELIKQNKYIFQHEEVNTSEMLNIAGKGDIPIGDICFITKYLNKVYGIEKENPIEIPKYLRTSEFLKRDYKIVTWDNLPEKGTWFIKDVSELKSFGSIVNTDYQNIKEWFEKPSGNFNTQLTLNKKHLFQVSNVFGVQSEYRVYVIGGKIEAICNYNGDCTVLPDINLLRQAVGLINFNEKWLKSYTIDLMVGKEGTAIIEIHNFASVGLYNTLWGSNLIYAYRDGIDYLVNDNKTLEV